MTKDLDGKIPVTIELGGSVEVLATEESAEEFARRLGSGLTALLEQLGLSGQPVVDLRRVESGRAVRLRVHDRNVPFSPDLMRRVWAVVAPADQRHLPQASDRTATNRFPDSWFAAYVSEMPAADGRAGREVAIDFLARLALEVIREQPGCLVGPAQATAYLGAAKKKGGEDKDLSAAISTLLTSLVNLGISVENRSVVLTALRTGKKTGRSIEDVVEAAFARLRPPRIQIHVHPQDLETLIPGTKVDGTLSVHAASVDDRLKEPFRLIEDGLFYELGVRLPSLHWRSTPDIPAGWMAVRINHQLRPATPLLPPGKLMVNQTVDGLKPMKVPAEPAVNPAYGTVIARVDESFREVVEEAGLTTWDRLGFVALTVYGELLRRTHRLLDVNEVESLLAQLEQAFPVLVQTALERFSIEEITRVLRALVEEGISIRNLRAILEKLLQYETIRLDASKYIVFDDRMTLHENTPAELAEHWGNYREFVRSGLKYAITQKYARSSGTLVVYLVDPELEARAAAVAANGKKQVVEVGFDDAEAEAIRDAVWAEVGAEATAGKRPVILTFSGARAALRRLLAPEFPDLAVVAYTELRPDQNIQPIARISLPKKE